MKSAAFLGALALAACSADALADETFRCGQFVISKDVPFSEIRRRCGEPLSREESVEDVRARTQFGLMVVVGQTVTEKWTFDRGARAAPMVVTIVDGKVKSIERKK